MSYDDLTKKLLEEIGGVGNINSVVHCATRLRFKLKDEDKAQTSKIENLDGVITVVKSGGQYQVVIGNQVSDVYDSFLKVSGLSENNQSSDSNDQKSGSILDRFIDLVSNIFAPVLGAMAAAGMIKGVASLLVALNVLSVTSGTYVIMYAIGDSFFYFLPVALGYTSAIKFKVDKFVGMMIGAALCYPTITAMNSSKTVLMTLFKGSFFESAIHAKFLGIPVVMMNYTSSVIPVIVALWFASHVQKWARKVIPDMMKSFFVPFFVMLIVIPVTFIVIGPVTTWLSDMVLMLLQAIYDFSPIVAGIFMGTIWQVLVIFGIHWGIAAVSLANMAKRGFDPFLALISGGSFAQIGVVLAMILQTKQTKLKSIGIPAFISGLFGITEPAIYGLTLPRKRPFIYSCIAAGVGGGMIGYYQTNQYVMGGFGIFSIPNYISPKDGLNMSFYGMIIAMVVSFILGFLMQFLLGRNYVDIEDNSVSKKEDSKIVEKNEEIKSEIIDSPMDGELVKLEDIDDPVFSTLSMGKGVAISPNKGIVYSPVDGEISLVFPTGHAIGIKSNSGAEILIHIGMDTVQLDGLGFDVEVEVGQKVKKGEEILKFDMELIESKGYKLITPVIITNTNIYQSITLGADNGPIYHNENLIKTKY